MDIVDIWVNLMTPGSAENFLGDPANAHIPQYLGGDGAAALGVEAVLGTMDANDVATSILCPGIVGTGVADSLAIADEHAGRFLVAGALAKPERPTRNVARIRDYAQHERFAMVRIMPLSTQVPINHALHYPVYSVCEQLQIPVAINVGVPGPRVRSRVQHPELLEDVLIDFPDLVIIGAHMGHPYEELLMNYMRKWPNLYLSCTAYAPSYFDPALVRFMNTSKYRGRVIWGSDEPWFPMGRSLAEARAVPIDEDAMARFLGGTARRLLDRTASR